MTQGKTKKRHFIIAEVSPKLKTELRMLARSKSISMSKLLFAALNSILRKYRRSREPDIAPREATKETEAGGWGPPSIGTPAKT